MLLLQAVASGGPVLDVVHHCDVMTLLKALPDESVNCIVTSPPYWGLRDYGVKGQIGLEETPDAFVARLVGVLREARRVLRRDGTCWVVIGDSYVGATSQHKGNASQGYNSVISKGTYGAVPATGRSERNKRLQGNGLAMKQLLGVPFRFALAMQADGWWYRRDIIWHKPNAMPESVKDRLTTAHEYVFLFSREAQYFYDQDAVRELGSLDSHGGGCLDYSKKTAMGQNGRNTGLLEAKPAGENGRNRRTVWSVNTKGLAEAHYAPYPPELIEPCIKAGCPVGGVVLDPFMGTGTTALVARQYGRRYVGCDLNREYVEMARRRLAEPYTLPMFEMVQVEDVAHPVQEALL